MIQKIEEQVEEEENEVEENIRGENVVEQAQQVIATKKEKEKNEVM